MVGILTQLAMIKFLSRVIINDHVGHFGEIIVLCHLSWVSYNIVMETVVYQLRYGLHLFMYIHYPLLVFVCCC